jgi:hypothetical protein
MHKLTQTRRDFLKTIGLGAASLALPEYLKAAGPIGSRPNIILIMADDLGYSDIGCYGGEIKTPNLDALAAGGMRFTQFYNCAKCSPTRATLLTGQYDQAVGVQNMEHGATFAEVLRAEGYRTIISGKWHQKPLRQMASKAAADNSRIRPVLRPGGRMLQLLESRNRSQAGRRQARQKTAVTASLGYRRQSDHGIHISGQELLYDRCLCGLCY